MPDPDVQKIGKYEIQAELGRGGFGRVYRAFDPTVGRPVAIKILTVEASRDVITRFRNEAAAAGNLRHRNIVTVYEFGEFNDRPYLVMELLEGEDLLQVINSGKKLTLLQKMNIMDQVADGLDCAHRNGVVHRDVKPANIRLLSDGTVKIMDFGIARVSRDQDTTRLTQQGDLVGTILYMSPEQFGGGEADALCDIFAYGVTYFELLTGKHPFRSSDPRAVMFKITMEDPEPIRNLAPDCPEALEQVLNRALHKDRELRYQSLRDLKLDAEPILLDLKQDRARDVVAKAQGLFDGNEVLKASQLVNEALVLDPTNRDARHLREEIQRRVQKQALQPRIESLLQTARNQIEKRSLSQAVQSLESAQKLDQTDTRINDLLASAREQLQRSKDATKLAVEAFGLMDRGQWSEGAARSQEASRLDPTNRDVVRALGAVDKYLKSSLLQADEQLAKNEVDSAIRMLQGLEEVRPGAPEIQERLQAALSRKAANERVQAACERAQASIAAGQFEEALAGLADGLKEFPDEARLAALRSNAERGLAARVKSERISRTGQQAESLLQSKNFDGALREIDGAIQAYPDAAPLAELKQKVQAAKAAHERNLAVEQRLEEARQLTGQGQIEKAVEHLQKAKGQFSGEERLEQALAQAQQALQDQRRKQAVDKAEADALACVVQKDFTGALKILEKAQKAWPGENRLAELIRNANDARASWEKQQAIAESARKAEEHAVQKRFPAALEVIQAALAKHGEDPALLKLRDRVAADQKTHERAEQAARKEAEARQLLDQKQTARAVEFLREASGLLPESEALRGLLAESEKRLQAEEARRKAIADLAAQSEKQAAENRFGPALEGLRAGLQKFGQDPALLELQKRIQEQWARQQRVETVRQIREDAQRLTAEGNPARAVDLLQNAVAQYPEEADLKPVLAGAQKELHAQKEREAAKRAADDAEALLGKQELEGALKILEQALKSWPGDARLVELARQANAARSDQERRAAVARIAQECEQFLRQSRFSEALQAAEAGLAQHPQEAVLLQLQKRAKDQRALQQRAEAVRQKLEEGRQLLKDARYQEAVQALEAWTRDYPEEALKHLLADARTQLRAAQRRAAVEKAAQDASAQASARQYAEAVKILERALKSWPGEVQLMELLQRTKDEGTRWEREQAVRAAAEQCEKLLSEGRHAEAQEAVQAALRQYKQEPALLQVRQRIQEYRENQQKFDAIRQAAAQARQFLDSDQPEQAVALLERAVPQYPSEEGLKKLLDQARAQLQSKQQREAVAKAAADAASLLEREDFEGAIRILDEGLRAWPDDARLRDLLAQAKASRDQRAKDQLALQQRRDANDKAVQEATRLAGTKNFLEAIATLERALQASPQEQRLTGLLEKIRADRQKALNELVQECGRLAKSNRFGDAAALIDAWVKSSGEDAAVTDSRRTIDEQRLRQERAEAVGRLVSECRGLIEKGQHPQAIQKLQDGSAKFPEAQELKQLLADANNGLRAAQRAEAVEKAAGEAARLSASKRFAQAIQTLESALRDWPGEKRLTELLQKVHAECEQAWKTLVSKCEQLAGAGRFDEALTLIAQWAETSGEDPAVASLRAGFEKRRQASEHAAAIQRSVEQGRKLIEQGNAQEAVPAIQKACKEFPEDPALKQLLADAQAAVKSEQHRQAVGKTVQEAREKIAKQDLRAAQKVVEKALKTWPGEQDLQELLQHIREQQDRRRTEDAQQVAGKAEAARAKKEVAQRAPQPEVPGAPGLLASRKVRGIAAAIGGVAILAAGAVGISKLLRTPGGVAVTIDSNLPGASIQVGGKSCTTPDCSIQLAPGSYTLTAAKEGYKPLSQSLSVTRGGAAPAVTLAFTPLPQMVQINTNFSKGRVVLDGKDAGDLRDGQLSLQDIAPGSHRVEVTGAEGRFETEWRSEAGAVPQLTAPVSAKNLLATVVANMGSTAVIACNCDPKTVQVDGSAVSGAAASAGGLIAKNLKEGQRRVSASDRSLLVDIRPNPTLNLFLTLDRNTGTLIVETGQDNSRVFLNNRAYRRLTEHGSLRIPLDVGDYSIRVEKDGFRSSAPQQIAVTKGEEKQVVFSLTALPAILEIAGAQPGTHVKVDSQAVGDTDASGALHAEVSPGRHQVELSKESFNNVQFTAQFSAGKTVRPARDQLAMTRVVISPSPQQIEAQDWDKVRASASVDELEDFLRKHAGGAHAEEARSKINQLKQQAQADAARKADQAAWDATDKTKKAALQDYINRFGAGAHVQEARGMIGEIDKRETEAASAQQAASQQAAQRAAEQRANEEQANRVTADRQGILRTLSAFEAAYNSKDVKTLESLWPQQDKAAFDKIKAQIGFSRNLTFRLRPSGQPVISGDTATVTCTRSLDIQTKDGMKMNSGNERVRVTMARTNAGWSIQDISNF